MTPFSKAEAAHSLYSSLAANDRDQLDKLLHPDFVGHISAGMPFMIGGTHDGPDAMRRNGWGAIARHFEVRVEAETFQECGADGLLVTGHYRGRGKNGGTGLDAAFAHLMKFEGGRIRSLEQYTDTKRWHEAASPLATITLEITDHIATLRLNRPDQGNAIDEQMARELVTSASMIAETPDVRAVVICGNGRNFTVGGDIRSFSAAPPGRLPATLRCMIDDFHRALERLANLDIPVVAAARGAVAGGGLGLLYVSDIVIASDNTKFALGYGALGLTSDGGNSWFLPRLVGLRRAQEMFLLNEPLTAAEALQYGLVSRLVADEALEFEARAVATRLAAGPTRALGGIRRLLRRSLESSLSDQLGAEQESIVQVAGSEDTQEGLVAFLERRAARFRGQ